MGCGLSFLSANLGSLELLGWAGSSYQYGILAAHWYWVGAIPAMISLGLVMMPFYYISKTHSVPGYLQLRFGTAASGLSAITFAVMTILMSGVNMYAMAVVMKVMLGWNIHFSIWVSSLTVGLYVAAGGLYSAIFNEVLQFFLIWFGALLIPIFGLIETGGWSGMVARIQRNFAGQDYTHLWSTLGRFQDNPMGMHWTGIVFGLGAVISMGYWTTDFLVVQRVLSAKDIRSAKMAPIIGSFFKMAVPAIVILPGLLALAVLPQHLMPESGLQPGQHSYNEVLPLMLARYFGPGLLGLGVTALVAGAQALAEDMYRALWSCLINVFVTVIVSLATRPKSDAELTGLVYGVTPLPKEGKLGLFERSAFWAAVAIALLLILQWIFW